MSTTMEDVDVPQETHDEWRPGAFKEFLGCAFLLNSALIHDDDAVSHLERLFLIVGHEYTGDVNLVMEASQPATQFLTDLCVKGAKRLVKEQHFRLSGQSTGQRNALPLAARELARITPLQPIQPNQSQQFVDTLANLGFGYVANSQAIADVLCDGHMAKERVMLKHETDLALTSRLLRDVLVIVIYGARFRHFQSRDHAEESGFS